jgi:hypothetical protein
VDECKPLGGGVNLVYTAEGAAELTLALMVGRCRLIGSKHVLKASVASALEARLSSTGFNGRFHFQLVPLHHGRAGRAARGASRQGRQFLSNRWSNRHMVPLYGKSDRLLTRVFRFEER